jgi:hypothetical protein
VAGGHVSIDAPLQGRQQIGQCLLLRRMRDRHRVEVGTHQPVEQHHRVSAPQLHGYRWQGRVHPPIVPGRRQAQRGNCPGSYPLPAGRRKPPASQPSEYPRRKSSLGRVKDQVEPGTKFGAKFC